MDTTIDKLKILQEQAHATSDFTALKEYCQTEEYKSLPYVMRNRGFITSHKMQEFMRCQWCYAQKYINLVPDPTEGDNEAFIIGQAIDDRLTEGEAFYQERYEVVARRSKESQKKQLTNTQGKLIEQMREEFLANKLFNPKPKKKIAFCLLGGFILKAELDDFSDEERMIKDVKTVANITTFNPQSYLHQMSFYQLVIEESEGLKCTASLEVIDKYGPFSRSALYHFTAETLFSNRGSLIEIIEKMRSAHDSGIFLPANDQAILYGCPYYGLRTNACPDGHGRPTKPVIF